MKTKLGKVKIRAFCQRMWELLPFLLAAILTILVGLSVWPLTSTRDWLCGAVATIPLTWAYQSFFQGRGKHRKVKQFLVLLEYLSSRIAAGQSLETSLTSAYRVVSQQTGHHSSLAKALSLLKGALMSKLGLGEALSLFNQRFRCPKAKSFLSILPFLHRFGGRMDNYIRHSHRALSEELTTQDEIVAEQSAKNTEALILIFMPFVIMFFLNQGSPTYLVPLKEAPWGPAMMQVLFLGAILSGSIALVIIAGADPYKERTIKFKEMEVKAPVPPWIAQLSDHIISFLPSSLGFKLAGAVRRSWRVNLIRNKGKEGKQKKLGGLDSSWLEEASKGTPDPFPYYIQQKLCLCAGGAIFAIFLLVLADLNPCLGILFTIAPSLLQDAELLHLEKKIQQEYRLEYPSFLNLCHILLSSGLSLNKALDLAYQSFLGEGDLDFYHGQTGGPMSSLGSGSQQALANMGGLAASADLASPGGYASSGALGSSISYAPYGRTLSTATRKTFFPSRNKESLIRQDFRHLQREIATGVTAADALQGLSHKVPSNEISSALQLIARYDRDGGKELLDILQLEAVACWDVYKNAMRKDLENRNILLVIPLGLDLLLVILSSVLPALAGFIGG